MSATAPPPTPLNSATICGIAVIFTLRAAGTPTAVPIARPTAMSSEVGAVERRGSAASRRPRSPMPTAAILLPCTAVVGLVSLARPMMNSANATMYAAVMKSAS